MRGSPRSKSGKDMMINPARPGNSPVTAGKKKERKTAVAGTLGGSGQEEIGVSSESRVVVDACKEGVLKAAVIATLPRQAKSHRITLTFSSVISHQRITSC
jgi:hypothetical protein